MADFEITSHGPSMFHLGGELDMATVPLLEAATSNSIAEGGPILFDVSKVRFIDSTGVHAIARAVTSLPSGCILLHGVQDGVRKVLNLTRVDDLPALHVVPCTVLT